MMCSDRVLRTNLDVLRFASVQFDKNLKSLDNGIAALGDMQSVINDALQRDLRARLPSGSLSPALDPTEVEVPVEYSIPTRPTLLVYRSHASPEILPREAVQCRSKPDKEISTSDFIKHLGDYPPVPSPAEFHAESSIPSLTALHAPRNRISPHVLSRADVNQSSKRQEKTFSGRRLEYFGDDLPIFNLAETQEESSVPDLVALPSTRSRVSPNTLPYADVVKRKRTVSPAVESEYSKDYPLILDASYLQAKSSVPNFAPLPAPRSRTSPDIIPYVDAQELSKWDERASPLSYAGPVDDYLPIFDPAEIQRQTSLAKFATYTRRRSFSPEEFEAIPLEEISRLMRKEDAFLDEDDSIPIAPLEPSLVDVFGVKLMCADVVSEPRRKKLIPSAADEGFISDHPPVFNAKEIQAESSDPIVAAFPTSRSCVSPDTLPYADVHRLLRRDESSPSPHEEFVDDYPPISYPEESQAGSILDVEASYGERISSSPESMPWRVVQPLLKRNRAFLDDDVSLKVSNGEFFLSQRELFIRRSPRHSGEYDLRGRALSPKPIPQEDITKLMKRGRGLH